MTKKPESESMPAALLARTNHHFALLGRSERNEPDTPANRHVPKHQFMSDGELRRYVQDDLEDTQQLLQRLRESDPEKKNKHRKLFLFVRDTYLVPNLRYLKEIGRLPKGMDADKIEKDLQITDSDLE